MRDSVYQALGPKGRFRSGLHTVPPASEHVCASGRAATPYDFCSDTGLTFKSTSKNGYYK